jgi:hypothetical protein
LPGDPHCDQALKIFKKWNIAEEGEASLPRAWLWLGSASEQKRSSLK